MINDGAAAAVDEIAKPFDHKGGIENFQTKPNLRAASAEAAPDATAEMPAMPAENAAKCTGGAA